MEFESQRIKKQRTTKRLHARQLHEMLIVYESHLKTVLGERDKRRKETHRSQGDCSWIVVMDINWK